MNTIHEVWNGAEAFWTSGEAYFDEGSGGRHGEKTPVDGRLHQPTAPQLIPVMTVSPILIRLEFSTFQPSS